CFAAYHLIVIFFYNQTFLLYLVYNQVKGQAKVDYPHVLSQEFFHFWLAVNVDALFSSLQRHCLQKPEQTYAVICMHMADEDFHFLVRAKACLDEVALHAFAGIKQQQLASPQQRYGGQPTLYSRGSRRGAKEDHPHVCHWLELR